MERSLIVTPSPQNSPGVCHRRRCVLTARRPPCRRDDLRGRSVFGGMKTLLILSLLALPLNAEIRGAARGGVFVGANHDAVGTIELDMRQGNWSFAPALDAIR